MSDSQSQQDLAVFRGDIRSRPWGLFGDVTCRRDARRTFGIYGLRRAGFSANAGLAAALKDAGFWALVAFALFLPLIGFRTVQDIRNVLVLETRWPLLFGFVAAVAAARLIHTLVIAPWRERRTAQSAARPRRGRNGALARYLLPCALGFVLAYPAIAVALAGTGGAVKWLDNFGMQILIYVMLGLGLNIVVGLAGLLDLGYVAFYAVGAYSYALLARISAFRSTAAAARRHPGGVLGHHARVSGAAVARRLSRHRHAGVRRDHPPGADQLGRPDQRLCRHHRHSAADLLRHPVQCRRRRLRRRVRTAVLTDLPPGVSLLHHSRPGAAHGLRHRAAAPAAGRPRLGGAARGRDRLPLARHQHHQHQAHRVRHGAMFGGFAGAFFAARQGFISPESFTFMESATILAIVVLGGMGSQVGVAIAAVAMIGGTEALRELDALKQVFGNDFDPTQYRMLLFGFAMVLIMILRPRGLMSTRHASVHLKERKAIAGTLVREGHG